MKRVEILDSYEVSRLHQKGFEIIDPIGWFTNSWTSSGWTISPLDEPTKEWLTNQGVNLTGVYRICGNYQISIAKFNFETGTVWFFDNKTYEETDRPTWLRGSAYRKVRIELVDEILALVEAT